MGAATAFMALACVCRRVSLRMRQLCSCLLAPLRRRLLQRFHCTCSVEHHTATVQEIVLLRIRMALRSSLDKITLLARAGYVAPPKSKRPHYDLAVLISEPLDTCYRVKRQHAQSRA